MHVRSKRLTLAAPAILIAAVCLSIVPILHPNNTCQDWLEKWGQLSQLPMWLPSHQIATLGFGVAAGTFLMLPYLGRISRTGILASSCMGVGLGAQGMLVVMHATAVSTLGAAFNATRDDATRDLYRTIAYAFVSYDVGLSGVAAILISGGAVAYAFYLRQLGWMSTGMAFAFAAIGSLWAAQFFGLHRILHIPTSEWIPYGSLSLWMAGVGIVLILGERSSEDTARLSSEEAAAV